MGYYAQQIGAQCWNSLSKFAAHSKNAIKFFLVTVANYPMLNHITNLSWSVPFSNLWFLFNMIHIHSFIPDTHFKPATYLCKYGDLGPLVYVFSLYTCQFGTFHLHLHYTVNIYFSGCNVHFSGCNVHFYSWKKNYRGNSVESWIMVNFCDIFSLALLKWILVEVILMNSGGHFG